MLHRHPSSLKHPIRWLQCPTLAEPDLEAAIEVVPMTLPLAWSWHRRVQPLINQHYVKETDRQPEDVNAGVRADVDWCWPAYYTLAAGWNRARPGAAPAERAVAWCVMATTDQGPIPVGMLTSVPAYASPHLDDNGKLGFVWLLSGAPAEHLFDVLFRALNIAGDVRSEIDRERALEMLSAVLLDPERSDQVLAALGELGGAADDIATSGLNGPPPKLVTRRAANAKTAMSMMDDAPSTGRLLNALQARTHAVENLLLASREFHSALASNDSDRSRAGARLHIAQLGRQLDTHPQLDHVSHEQYARFIVQARKALPERSPSWLQRLADAYDVIKGSNAEWTWPVVSVVTHANLHHLECQLRHGPREWHFAVHFFEPKVTVLVANKNTTVIERDVATTKPEDFSQSLLHAFDGDIRSTQMALDAVQQAIAVDGRALH